MDARVANDISTIGRISAVPSILEIVTEVTGLRFAAVARVTADTWTACAVLDKVDFGLSVGGDLDISTTLCREVRTSEQPIIIEHASRDASFCEHPTPRMYGFESYISVPIVRRNGEIFGTICALDPRPANLRDPKILRMVTLYAELIAAQLEIEDQLEAKDAALTLAIEAGALREQFVAVLGHDLRNPLFSIFAGLRMLGKSTLNGRAASVVEQMHESATRMSRLVDDILDFARARLGGGIAVERRPVADLDAELMKIITEVQSANPNRVIEHTVAIQGAIDCDPHRVTQLFSNLLSNAVTHGAPDKPVRVNAHGAAGALTLAVSNAGAPISPDTMARLFKPYARPAQDAPRAGLGLGLYIAAEIARSHEGTITVSSTAAHGTTFTFRLGGAGAMAPRSSFGAAGP